MKIQIGSDGDYTLVGNIFIDRYMPSASGEFVKVYLYLLRCASTGRDISVSSIADVFDHTEKDVLRAFAYWEKLGLLNIEYDMQGNPVSVSLLSAQQEETAGPSSSVGSEDFSVSPAAPAQSRSSDMVSGIGSGLDSGLGSGLGSDMISDMASIDTGIPVPSKSNVSPQRVKELGAQDAIQQLIFVGSQYKKSPLRTSEVQNIIYFYDELHFSTDLIEYLMEYCVSKGNPGPRYMEKVAQEWYRSGIKTVTQAKENTSAYNKDFYTIMKYLGITGRAVTKAEAEFMDRWTNEYLLSMDLIEEACRRTVLQTGSGSFSYADSILKSWKEHNVHTMDDIRREDEMHARRSATAKSNAAAKASAGAAGPNTGNGGAFGRFPQRDYNWNELEAQLLAAQSGKGE